jgi:hypothetical protein
MEKDKQQTAVEWLVNQLEKHYVLQDIKNTTAFLQAKEMHKQEIIDAFDEGNPNGFINKTGEQYYNETYGGGNK